MSEYSWEGQTEHEPRPRDLREQIDKLSAKLTARDQELEDMRRRVRSQDAGSILSSTLGLNPRIAELIPDSVEVTEAGIRAWVDTYADLFVKPPEGDEASTEGGEEGQAATDAGQGLNLTQEQIDAILRLQSQEASPGSTTPGTEATHLAQLEAARAAANGSSDRFFEILRSGKPATPTT